MNTATPPPSAAAAGFTRIVECLAPSVVTVRVTDAGLVRAGQAELAGEDRNKDGGGPPVSTLTEGIAMFDLHLVRHGMRVVDATGDEVGQVDDVKMGDPAAATAEGQSQEYESFTDLLARTVSAGGELPTERRERLLRLGYVKVIAARRLGEDFYVPADQLDHVEADVVYLGVVRPL